MSNENTALLRVDANKQLATPTDAAEALKQEALAESGLVGKVSNQEENDKCAQAHSKLAEFRREVIKAHKEAKKSSLEFGRRIDEAKDKILEEVLLEEERLTKLSGDFLQLQAENQKGALQAANNTLTELERKEAEEIATATTHDQVDGIRYKYDLLKRGVNVGPIQGASKAKGQSSKPDLEINVVNIHELYRFHPNLVDMTPRKADIKSQIQAGVKVHGVESKEITRVIVRTLKKETVDV